MKYSLSISFSDTLSGSVDSFSAAVLANASMFSNLPHVLCQFCIVKDTSNYHQRIRFVIVELNYDIKTRKEKN